jgi:thiamine biosynthesis lipoprotein
MQPQQTSTRREFLKGQAAAQQVADWADGASVSAPAALPMPSTAEPYLVQLSRQAMACNFEVFLNAGQYEQATEAAIEALDLVEQLEAQLTVYRATSEISALNLAAHEGFVEVEPRLFALLAQAVQLHRETGAAFDITSGSLSKVWGFFRRQGAIPQVADLQTALASVGSQCLELDATSRSVRFLKPGVELNLGSIGKGYALDRCAELMTARGVRDFLWHGGQSSVLARGACAGNGPEDRGWSVGVRHPLRPDRRLAEIRLCDRALATSGSSVQFFRYGGKRYGHILDPRTGWPAEGVFSATVVAPTAAEADALSTAFYVLGPQAALEFCDQHTTIGTIILYPGSAGNTVELATAGLESDEWRLLRESTS